MKKSSNFFKARHDMAIAISERTFNKCDSIDEPKIKTETTEEFLKRGGKIIKIPRERRSSK